MIARVSPSFAVKQKRSAIGRMLWRLWRTRFVERRIDQMHVASNSGGPKVRTVATKAAMVVQTIAACTKLPAWPKAGSGAPLAALRRIHPIATTCAKNTITRVARKVPAGQANTQPMACNA